MHAGFSYFIELMDIICENMMIRFTEVTPRLEENVCHFVPY
jgi:hypothetical protein